MADEKPQSTVINTTTHGIFKRTTFVVPNAEEAAA